MNNLVMKKILLLIFILSLAAGSADGQILKKHSVRKTEKGLSGRSAIKRKEPKVKEPRTVLKAKKKQEANEKKLKSEYNKSIERSQKRTYDIQTPDVQARMKQNQKDAALRDKARKKSISSSTKKAGKKYK
jgi:hypothetical protein